MDLTNDLERHVLDPNIAKSESEWWAKGRIEELERERDGWKASAENRLEIQRQREERITELVGALDRISEGDIGRPHKVEKCAHEKYGFEHCEECYCDFARAALAKVRKP